MKLVCDGVTTDSESKRAKIQRNKRDYPLVTSVLSKPQRWFPTTDGTT